MSDVEDTVTSACNLSVMEHIQKLLSMSVYMPLPFFSVPSPVEHQICPAVCVLMKLSFDEEHRHAMNELGELVKETADRVFLSPPLNEEVLTISLLVWVNLPLRWAAGSGRAAPGGLRDVWSHQRSLQHHTEEICWHGPH